MLSTIPFASKQAKKLSRARQQWARDWRLGASKAPSGEGVGFVCVGWGFEIVVKRPMVLLGGGGWLVAAVAQLPLEYQDGEF